MLSLDHVQIRRKKQVVRTERSVCRVHNNWFPKRLYRWKSNVYVHIMVSEARIFALDEHGAYTERKIRPNFQSS